MHFGKSHQINYATLDALFWHYLTNENYQGVHYMLLLLAIQDNQPRGPSKGNPKYSCYVAARYQHWAVSLPLSNFV